MRASLFFLIAVSASSPLLAVDDWWQFRGPDGNGHVRATDLPLKWNEKEHIAWKTPIHDRGWSSPVIWRNQVWMTTATSDGRKLFAVCVDRDSGKIIHDIHVFDVEQPARIAADNSYASPTPVIEEGRVYVHYGTYGTACLDSASGGVVWTRRDLKCDHEAGAGPGSSPFLVGDLFVVHVDGRDVQYVIALDKSTGTTVWKTVRSVDYSQTPVNQRKAYCMPIVIPRGSGTQLVSPGAKAVFAYEPATGKELWRVRHRGWSIAPRPVFGLGLVFAIVDRDHPELWAIRPDGSGDVTDSHVVWKVSQTMPPRSSPLLVDGLLFLVNRIGVASCIEAKTGEIAWRERIEGGYSASPIYANDRIYFFNEKAICTVIKPSRRFEVLAVNRLAEEQLMASPAVGGKSLFIRTEKHLYRIEDSTGSPQAMDDKRAPQDDDGWRFFVGQWSIGASDHPSFVMTLNEDFTAKKSHVPKATGKWEYVSGEARVTWSDGWRDILRREGKKYRKVAFRPGTTFDSPPSNTESAEKKTVE